MFQFTLLLPVKFNPEIGNPQDTDKNGGHNHKNPRNPHPRGDHALGLPTGVESDHFQNEQRAQHSPDDRIEDVERPGQCVEHLTGEAGVVPPEAGQGPDVLAGAGGLGEGEEEKHGTGAVAGTEAACEEDEEGGGVVEDEEDVGGGEGEEVEDVGGEVGDAEVECGGLGGGVGGGEGGGGGRVGEEGVEGEDDGGSAVEEGDGAAGCLGPGGGAPVPEDDEVGGEVDEDEEGDEERERRQRLNGGGH